MIAALRASFTEFQSQSDERESEFVKSAGTLRERIDGLETFVQELTDPIQVSISESDRYITEASKDNTLPPSPSPLPPPPPPPPLPVPPPHLPVPPPSPPSPPPVPPPPPVPTEETPQPTTFSGNVAHILNNSEPDINLGSLTVDDAITLKIYYAAPTKLCPFGDYTPTLIVQRVATLQNAMSIVLPNLSAQYASEYRYWRAPASQAGYEGWYFPVSDIGALKLRKIDLATPSEPLVFRDGDGIVIEPKFAKGWFSAFAKDFVPPPPPPKFISL